MDQIQGYLTQLQDFLQNPYVIGVISLIAIVYGSLIAPALPPKMAAWFVNPLFKVFFIFLILAVREIHPMIAILLALGLIISMQTVNRYHVFGVAHQLSQVNMTHPANAMPNEEERQQMNNEINEEMQKPDINAENMPRPIMTAEDKPLESLHPMNRPTWATTALSPRVENPNDPDHPGWKTLYDPNVDVSIYELNPPFLRKNRPNQFQQPPMVSYDQQAIYPPQYEDKIQGGVRPPQKAPSRYSAYYGYPVLPETIREGFHMQEKSHMYQEIDQNMLNPMVTERNQRLPNQFASSKSLGNQMEVVAQLTPGYSGAQGLDWQPGFPGCKVGAEYATPTSEL